MTGIQQLSLTPPQVAKMLKEIPRGATFVIRLVEPLKAGFCKYSVLFPSVPSVPSVPPGHLTWPPSWVGGPAGRAAAPPVSRWV